MTIGNYAYDWHDGTGDPENIDEAWVDAGDSDARPSFDPIAANSTFAYDDEEGHPHSVWMLDAASAFNELTPAQARRDCRRRPLAHGCGRPEPMVDLRPQPVRPADHGTASSHLRQGTNVDIEGPGEIIRITALPTPGERSFSLEPTRA